MNQKKKKREKKREKEKRKEKNRGIGRKPVIRGVTDIETVKKFSCCPKIKEKE